MAIAMVTLTPNTEAPDFELVDVSGTPIRLSEYRGERYVVLDLLRGLW